ncbi:restriction endonuclease subunit S domain-containing protein, partial [Enterococcus faecium]
MTDVLGAALPEDWSVDRLKKVVTYLSRGTAPEYVDDGPIRAISQAANQYGYLDWSRTRFHSYKGPASELKGYLEANDILVNSTGKGTLGRVCFFDGAPDNIPCMADSHVTIVRTDNRVANSRFTYYWLNSQTFQDYI